MKTLIATMCVTGLLSIVFSILNLTNAVAATDENKVSISTVGEEGTPKKITFKFLVETFAIADTVSVFCSAKHKKDINIQAMSTETFRRSRLIRNMFNRVSQFEIPTAVKLRADVNIKNLSKTYLNALIGSEEISDIACTDISFASINKDLGLLYSSMLKSA
jgi:hypothetical protein